MHLGIVRRKFDENTCDLGYGKRNIDDEDAIFRGYSKRNINEQAVEKRQLVKLSVVRSMKMLRNEKGYVK